MPDQALEPARGATSRNPADGSLIATYPFQTAEAIESTLAGCAAAYATWRATPMEERVACYGRLAATLRARAEPLARLITAEMGRTLALARYEVEKCAATIEWFAEHGPAVLADEPAPVDGDNVYVSFLPIGTVLGVMPWNLPLWQAIRAAGPILLSGNGFLLKHATNVMGCAFALQEVYEASAFPKGLFANLNTDNDTVARVIEDPRIAAVSVTGSVRAGSAVAATAARVIKKSVLELGGADPFIVLVDADLDGAVKAAVQSRYENAGQVCLAAKRIILERPIAEEFTRKFVDAAAALKVGDPMHEATFVGPIARGDLRDGIHDQVERSIKAGARLLLGGHKMNGPGYFYEPTVLADVRPGMAAFDEEIFGPVGALVVAEDVEDAIRLANASEYGLSGNVWTADVGKAQAMARRLETGGVFVNGFTASNARVPVGGVKKSGFGRELSHFGLREFTNAQTVWVKAPA
ncbi:NAD-dependent succinate-semialdehyde dehydrogenase [Methylobacterium oryzae]|uniref:NAD-dependent succinate-semialdehyde dehydrogenase n=1 Tax=Methylobacterium oryzae TaxID=334852 RepID=UPI001F4798D0|nr:NAD-dependent succinate-semialdehyde dehydrogenase [Methylobacterium oryzae]UIN35035.1 NAD-dependent succinate-semialdehyde dehydrogenase [Methylobacterium oryzae]